jgi:hypothetical protein
MVCGDVEKWRRGVKEQIGSAEVFLNFHYQLLLPSMFPA